MTNTLSTDEIATDVYGIEKPRLRGIVHAWAIGPFAVAGVLLTLFAPTTEARVSCVIYALAITGMFAASASYHRLRVSEKARNVLRRVDHSMIGVAVAGTYTPVVALTLEGAAQTVLLALLWVGALFTLVLSVAWPHGPRWLRAGAYLALGWAGIVVVPSMVSQAGYATLFWVIAGAAFYSAGAVVYGRRKPNISVRWFGFHELFHSLVTAAAACHFVAVAAVVERISGF